MRELALWLPGEMVFIFVPVLLLYLEMKQKPFLSSVAFNSYVPGPGYCFVKFWKLESFVVLGLRVYMSPCISFMLAV